MQTVVKYTCLGMWLSWLERFAHIEEVSGSNPDSPTKLQFYEYPALQDPARRGIRLYNEF